MEGRQPETKPVIIRANGITRVELVLGPKAAAKEAAKTPGGNSRSARRGAARQAKEAAKIPGGNSRGPDETVSGGLVGTLENIAEESAAPQGPVLTYEIDPKSTPAGMAAADMDKLLKVVDRRINADSKIVARVRDLDNKQIEIALLDQDEESAKRVQRLLDRAGTLEFRILANRHDHQAIIAQIEGTSKDELLDSAGKKLAWWVPLQSGAERPGTRQIACFSDAGRGADHGGPGRGR